jgi:4-hydroxy-L-threonine phosphate dehydrogenase PdxA
MKNKPILVVAGDPQSVFLEIFFKAINFKKYKSSIILICNKKILKLFIKKNNINKKIKIFNLKELYQSKLNPNYVNLVDVECKNIQSLKHVKKYLNQSFNIAFELLNNNFTNKFINGPINKKKFLDNKLLGITEYISNKYNIKNSGMLIYNKHLSVCPLTTHLPIKMVYKYINKKVIIDKIKLIDSFFKTYLKVKPRIAVTGLNPHCESILKFNEDEKIVTKAIINQRDKGLDVNGPFPADTIFLKKNRDKYNVILGMYHDQVLAPIKAIYEFQAINITMGLPFLRITPDHGPNISMIGKNKSNPISLIRALEFLD